MAGGVDLLNVHAEDGGCEVDGDEDEGEDGDYGCLGQLEESA